MPVSGLRTPSVGRQVSSEELRDFDHQIGGQRRRRIEKVKWERPSTNGFERYHQQKEEVRSSGENGFREQRCRVESFASDAPGSRVRQTHCHRVGEARTADGWALTSSSFQFISSTQVSGIHSTGSFFESPALGDHPSMDLDIVEVFPQLDNSPQKGRSELAQKGSLGHRRPPTRAGIKAFVSSVWESNDDNNAVPPPSPRVDSPLPPLLHQNGKHSDVEEDESEVDVETSVPVRGWKRPPKHAVLVFPMQLLSANKQSKDHDDMSLKEQTTSADDDEDDLQRNVETPPAKTGPTIVSITLKNPEKSLISIGGQPQQTEAQPTQVLIRPYTSTTTDNVRPGIVVGMHHESKDRRPLAPAGTHSTVVFLNRDNASPSPLSSRASSPAQERLTRRDSQRSNVDIQTWERRRASPSPSPSPSRARLRDLVTRPASITGDEWTRRREIPSPSSRRSSPSGQRYSRPSHIARSEGKPEWLRKIDLDKRRGIDWENLEKQQRRAVLEEERTSPTRSEPRGRSSSDSFLLERDSVSRRSDGCARWTPAAEPEWIQIARRRRQNRIDWESIEEKPRTATDSSGRASKGVEPGEDVAVQVNLRKKKVSNRPESIIQSILSKVRGGNDDDLQNLPLVVQSSAALGGDANNVKRTPERGWSRRPKKETSLPKWTEREVLIEDLPRPEFHSKRDSSPRRDKGLQKFRQPLRVRSPSPPRRRHQVPPSSPSSSEGEMEPSPDTPSSKKKVRFMISGDRKIPAPTPSAGYTLFGMDPPSRNPSGNKENVPLVETRTRKHFPPEGKAIQQPTKDESEDDYQLKAYRIIRHIKQLTKERGKEGKSSRDSSPESSGRRTPEWMKKSKHKSSINWEKLGACPQQEERPIGVEDGCQVPVWAHFQLKRTPFSKKYLLNRRTDEEEVEEVDEPNGWVVDPPMTLQDGRVKRSETNNLGDSEGYSSMESSGGPVCAHCGHPQEEWPAMCSGACKPPPVVVESLTKQPSFKRGNQTKTVRKTLRRILRGPHDQGLSQQGDEEIVEEITEEVFDLPGKSKTKKHIIRTVQQNKDGQRFLSTTIAADGPERG